jgi:hypothetical protein
MGGVYPKKAIALNQSVISSAIFCLLISYRPLTLVPISVTLQRIRSRSVKDAFREGIPEVGASAVPAGRPIQPAPGRFGHQPAGIMTGARGASLEVGDGVGGVKPAALAPPPTKHGPGRALGMRYSPWQEPWWNAGRRAGFAKPAAAPQGAEV